jgi:LacI family transcriptional regulator
MKVQLDRIAAECGVSTMTVSRALDPARSHLVSEKRRREILACCEKYEYVPNYSARTLASGKTRTIGLLHPGSRIISRSPTYGKMLSYLANALRKYDYFVTLLPFMGKGQETIDREIVRTFRSGRVDGYISLAAYIGERAQKEMARHNFPIVTFNMPSDRIQENSDTRRVHINSLSGVKALFEHLHALGHTKIAYVGKGNLFQRDDLYCRFLAAEKDFIRLDDERQMTMNKYLAGYRLVMNGWEQIKKYTALTCSNDEYAMGICEALKDRGLVPGRDMAVAGFDNSEADKIDAFLTTIHPPLEEAADECARILLSQIAPQDDQKIMPVSLNTRLVIRNSTVPNTSTKGATI